MPPWKLPPASLRAIATFATLLALLAARSAPGFAYPLAT
jgi:hypothetical protein